MSSSVPLWLYLSFQDTAFLRHFFGKSHTINSDDVKLLSVGNNSGHITCTESTSYLFVHQIRMHISPWKIISGTALKIAVRNHWIIKASLQCTISAVSYLPFEQCSLIYIWDNTYIRHNCLNFMVCFIGPSLHNNVVQSLYYATKNWATCFDPTGPSSGL